MEVMPTKKKQARVDRVNLHGMRNYREWCFDLDEDFFMNEKKLHKMYKKQLKFQQTLDWIRCIQEL